MTKVHGGPVSARSEDASSGEAIAFLTVITAAVTSSFVERVRLKYRAEELAIEAAGEQRIEARLAVIADRLERIEQALDELRRQNNAAR